MFLMLVKGLSALLPAAAHLAGLMAMDGYKLVRMRSVLWALFWGFAAAAASTVINDALISSLEMSSGKYSALVAPIIEESLKVIWVATLISSRRLGFPVDAAILGFASGVGFAIAENLLFLSLRPETGLLVWLVRGFATAVMHGSTVAVFGIIAQTLCEQKTTIRPWHLVPGLLVAILIHSVFNQFLISPVAWAFGLLVGLPSLMYLVFRASDRSLQHWLGRGMDVDALLLHAINEGRFTQTPVGSYLLAIRDRFPPETVADMFCLLKLSMELSLEAKGLLLMRGQGFEQKPSPEVPEKLREVEFLRRSIGPTGRMALAPLLPRGRKDLWQREFLS
jgi:RsiW-degrading membrane proteinase PrsW (M82 family)